jgi:hypothetical protein
MQLQQTCTGFTKVRTIVVNQGADSNSLRLRFLVPVQMGYLRARNLFCFDEGELFTRASRCGKLHHPRPMYRSLTNNQQAT